MIKILGIYLILSLLGITISTITKFGITLSSVVTLILTIVFAVSIWKGLEFSITNPETKTKKKEFVRWIILFYFSTAAVEVGIITSLWVRFFLDSWISSGIAKSNSFSILISRSGWIYGEMLFLIFPALITLPFLILIAKTLRFKNYKREGVLTFLIWIILLHLPKILGR